MTGVRSSRPTRAHGVADDLGSRIRSGALAPGSALRETELEAHYGVSRHTVRQALAQLVSERLATSIPFSGVAVARIDAEGLVALQELRCALESEAVRLLRSRHGTRWPPTVTGPIVDALDELERACLGSDVDMSVERAHSRVHTAIVRAASSRRITEAYEGLDAELLVFLRHIRPELETARLTADHRALLSEVQERGTDAIRDHLDASTELLARAARNVGSG
ncbi:GntR family transcriptional regulator [Labedella endophytica]|uniref:GntR family transcriptional regulator n=1 Tax=Labedella endophytica TaxID=1523160 RepID=UPI0014095615|nr:GntR family transcriptional regulator [Labedella endophytica]